MKALSEIRRDAGLSQQFVCRETGLAASSLSTFENHLASPSIEQMVLLEEFFGQRIQWTAGISNNEEKISLLTNILHLTQLYPIEAVFNFVLRSLKEDHQAKRAIGSTIESYTKRAKKIQNPGELLLPPEIE